MSFTILYRHPERPDEAGMTLIVGQEQAEAMINQLEERGFLVEKITCGVFAKAAPPGYSP